MVVVVAVGVLLVVCFGFHCPKRMENETNRLNSRFELFSDASFVSYLDWYYSNIIPCCINVYLLFDVVIKLLFNLYRSATKFSFFTDGGCSSNILEEQNLQQTMNTNYKARVVFYNTLFGFI